MAIKGSLKEASLPDVLQLLSMGRKTGCLGLSFHDSFGSIYFDGGRICHAAIVNRPLDTENSVYTLFTWTSGTFNFEPGVQPEEGAERVSVDPQSLLLEGARRVDEWSLIEKRIPSFDVVFSIDRPKLLMNRDPLSPEQEGLLPLIDGHRDINGLIRDSGLGEFEVGKALYGLLNASFLLPVGRKRTTPTLPRNASPIERRELASALYRAGMHDEAIREFRALVEEAADPVASFHLGLIALRKKEWAAAVNAFMTAAPNAPSKTTLLHNLAIAYEQLKQLEKAKLVIDRALAAGGKTDPLIQLQAAVIALHLGDLQSAKVALSEARSLWTSTPPPPVWFHYAAQVAAMTDDPDREMLLLAAATETHPESPALLNNLAAAYLKRGDYTHARDTAEKGLALAPELSQLRRNLSAALEEFRAPIETRRNRPADPEGAPVLIQGEDGEFRALMDKITRDRGFQCSSYKDKCLRRRIAVRMRAKGASSHAEYAVILDADAREYERLIRSLTINVTKFFRNWETYAVLEQKVIPALWDRRERELRVWSAGCASGEEPYSVGILMHKHAAETNQRARLESVSIVGTDIEADCLGEAERALYAETALGDTPAELRERYFPEVAGMRTMLPDVRRRVTFQCSDLLRSKPPFHDIHLLVCRNVIIYLEREAQDMLFADFHRALAPGGFLVLGKVETLFGAVRSLFSPVNARERIFRKI